MAHWSTDGNFQNAVIQKCITDSFAFFFHELIIRNSKSEEHFCRCSKGCIKNKRKRREVTRDGGNQEESTNKIILTGGPVVFEAAKKGEPLDHSRFPKK